MSHRNAQFNFHLTGLNGGWAWWVFDGAGAQIGAGHDRDRRVAAARIIQTLIAEETRAQPRERAELRAA